MQNLIISPEIEQKLARKHGLKRTDIEQCFRNRLRSYLIDKRLEHLTDPPNRVVHIRK